MRFGPRWWDPPWPDQASEETVTHPGCPRIPPNVMRTPSLTVTVQQRGLGHGGVSVTFLRCRTLRNPAVAICEAMCVMAGWSHAPCTELGRDGPGAPAPGPSRRSLGLVEAA
ncbi:hypothetical protein GCM10009635_47460 [Actinocatenispora thailandica]